MEPKAIRRATTWVAVVTMTTIAYPILWYILKHRRLDIYWLINPVLTVALNDGVEVLVLSTEAYNLVQGHA